MQITGSEERKVREGKQMQKRKKKQKVQAGATAFVPDSITVRQLGHIRMAIMLL